MGEHYRPPHGIIASLLESAVLTSNIKEIAEGSERSKFVDGCAAVPPGVVSLNGREVEVSVGTLRHRWRSVILQPFGLTGRIGVHGAVEGHGHLLQNREPETGLSAN